MTTAFFASYARLDNMGDDAVVQFIKALRLRVQKLMGEDDPDAICFLDVADIASGAVWEDRLADAVNRARVLVCLCSPAFLKREFCAKEFDVFRQRLEADSLDDRRAVIPVLWDKVPHLPQSLSRFQVTGMPDGYVAGVRKLVMLEDGPKLSTVVDRLAEDIVSAVRQEPALDPLSSRPVFAKLASSFDNPSPDGNDIGVLVAHTDGPSWKVDRFGETVKELIEPIFEREGLCYRILEPDLGSGERPEANHYRELLTVGLESNFATDRFTALMNQVAAGDRPQVRVVGLSSAGTRAGDFCFTEGSVIEFKAAAAEAVASILVKRTLGPSRRIDAGASVSAFPTLPRLDGPS